MREFLLMPLAGLFVGSTFSAPPQSQIDPACLCSPLDPEIGSWEQDSSATSLLVSCSFPDDYTDTDRDHGVCTDDDCGPQSFCEWKYQLTIDVLPSGTVDAIAIRDPGGNLSIDETADGIGHYQVTTSLIQELDTVACAGNQEVTFDVEVGTWDEENEVYTWEDCGNIDVTFSCKKCDAAG